MTIFNAVPFLMISTTKKCLKPPKMPILAKVLIFVPNFYFDFKKPLNYFSKGNIARPYFMTFNF